MARRNRHDGLRMARLLMVFSSISPLFILWAIRGNPLIPDKWFIAFCGAMIVLPNAFLWIRIRTAIKLQERRDLAVGTAEDHREHLLVYLFAMLLPFYPTDMVSWRDLIATLAALGFVVFLFWHLNLHYMNLAFALRGYRVFTIHPSTFGSSLSGKENLVLITKRTALLPGERLAAYRLSDSVYFEADE